jgi:hypothetical protein
VSPSKKTPERDEYSADFEKAWTAYPRKDEKAGAYRQWQARIKGGAKPDDLILAAERYAVACEKANTERQYIKLGKTFWGPSRPYEDHLRAPPVPIPRQQGKSAFGESFEALKREGKLSYASSRDDVTPQPGI